MVPSSLDVHYRPAPRLREGRLLRSFASACMDTSDGALAAVDQLERLNDVGFVLELSEAVHPAAAQMADLLRLPPWMMLAGLHGEFELLFTVSPDVDEGLLYGAECDGWRPVYVGHVVAEPGVWVVEEGRSSALDTGGIRNLFAEPPRDVREIIAQLKTMVKPCTQ